MNRIRYGTACLLAVWLLAVLSGCARQASANASAGTGATADGVEIVSRDFSHSGYMDSIAFLLPSLRMGL